MEIDILIFLRSRDNPANHRNYIPWDEIAKTMGSSTEVCHAVCVRLMDQKLVTLEYRDGPALTARGRLRAEQEYRRRTFWIANADIRELAEDAALLVGLNSRQFAFMYSMTKPGASKEGSTYSLGILTEEEKAELTDRGFIRLEAHSETALHNVVVLTRTGNDMLEGAAIVSRSLMVVRELVSKWRQNPSNSLLTEQIAEQCGMPPEEVQIELDRLAKFQYVKRLYLDIPQYRVTELGVVWFQECQNPKKGLQVTHNDNRTTTNNIRNSTIGQLSNAGDNSTITQNQSTNDLKQVVEFVQSMRELLPQLKLSDEQRANAQGALEDVEPLLNKDRPNKGMILAGLSGLWETVKKAVKEKVDEAADAAVKQGVHVLAAKVLENWPLVLALISPNSQ